MARTSTYLNFPRTTEEAFNFYKKIFGTEFEGVVNRFKDNPSKDYPPPSIEDQNLIMHIALPILGGHMLMGTDAPESMGLKLNFGNNVYINLEPDTRGGGRSFIPRLIRRRENRNAITRNVLGRLFRFLH